MCGRYALGVRMFIVRQRLQDHGMQVDDAPEDDDIRETYNFAPGYYGAVYRGDVGDDLPPSLNNTEEADDLQESSSSTITTGATYKLQKMRWGLIPFWTKRQPDYGSMLKTINCRDDSLMEDKGMWTTMKRTKRCVIVCQGFYEWLKKGPGGKVRVPHYTRRKDGDLMYFAGLWDAVQYEGADEKLYTYTIITTDSNPYLKFLHDRMPVILEPGSENMKRWLDPNQKTWTKELQSILRPYEGELECYPVSNEVNKVGNNSPNFIIPVNSKENKSNIANFFANADVNSKKKNKTIQETEDEKAKSQGSQLGGDRRETVDGESTEHNAPKPVPDSTQVPQKRSDAQLLDKVKRERSPDNTTATPNKALKRTEPSTLAEQTETSPKQAQTLSKIKMRSATENRVSPTKSKKRASSKHVTSTSTTSSQKITDFFKK